MKKPLVFALFLASMVITLSSRASADFVRNQGTCQSRKSRPDHGFMIDLKYVMTAGRFSYVAELSEKTPAGLVEVDTFEGLQLVESEVPGAGFQYQSRDVVIQFPVVREVRGMKVARIHAISKGRVINDTMLCRLGR